MQRCITKYFICHFSILKHLETTECSVLVEIKKFVHFNLSIDIGSFKPICLVSVNLRKQRIGSCPRNKSKNESDMHGRTLQYFSFCVVF